MGERGCVEVFFEGVSLSVWLRFFVGLSLASCSLFYRDSMERRNVESFFVGHGITRYLLPRRPAWANRSFSGQCVRQSALQMFHMPLLRGSFFLTYQEAHQWQLSFNVELGQRQQTVSLKGEEEIFFRASDQVLAGVYLFNPPEHRRVHLIWIDPLWRREGGKARLREIVSRPSMQRGHPVLVSLCHPYRQVRDDLQQLGLGQADIRLATFELFNPYSRERELLSYDSLNFSAFFKKEQELHFFLPKGENLPREFVGRFRVHALEF